MMTKTAGRLVEINEPGVVSTHPGSWPNQHHLEDTMNGSGNSPARGKARVYFARMMAEGDPESGCWIWPYAQNGTGYGFLTINRRTTLVHRLAFCETHGHWPLVGRHRCDTKLCFNPAHIEDGTMADNSRDMVERSPNHRCGERHPTAKLTEADVREIRRLLADGAMYQKDIAARFGVANSVVTNIKTGHRWGRVT